MSDRVIVSSNLGQVHIRIDSHTLSKPIQWSLPVSQVQALLDDTRVVVVDDTNEYVMFADMRLSKLVFELLIAKLEGVLLTLLTKSSIEALMAVGVDLHAGVVLLPAQEHMSFREAVRLITGKNYGLASPMQG